MKLKTVLVRKAESYEGIKMDTKTLLDIFRSKPVEIEIDKVIEVTKEEFDYFKNNLLEDMDFIKENNKYGYLLIKERGANDEEGIIVEPTGYDYARYSGIPVKDEDVYICDTCKKYFIGHPAVSRKDNKTEICSECATKEALEDFKNKEVIEFCLSLQDKADELNVEITVTTPEGFERIVKPNK